jgi:hypothetical protein
MADPTTPARLPKRFRTVLHGTCLLHGRHPADSDLARECPLLTAGKRSERSRRAARTRWAAAAGRVPEASEHPDGSGAGSDARGLSQAQEKPS